MTSSYPIISISIVAITIPFMAAMHNENKKLEKRIQDFQESEKSRVVSASPMSTQRHRELSEVENLPQKTAAKNSSEKAPLDAVHLMKSQRLDLLVDICAKHQESIFPGGRNNVEKPEFNENFEPHEGLGSLFSLSEEQVDALKVHGQKSLAKVQQWEIQNAEAITDTTEPDKVTYRIPAMDQELKECQEEFKSGIREIIGDEPFSLIEKNLERNFREFQHSVEISFSVEKGKGANAKLDLFVINRKFLAGEEEQRREGLRRTGGSQRINESTLSMAVGNTPHSEERRYAHLFEIVRDDQ